VHSSSAIRALFASLCATEIVLRLSRESKPTADRQALLHMTVAKMRQLQYVFRERMYFANDTLVLKQQ
jgi:hypothetical protein